MNETVTNPITAETEPTFAEPWQAQAFALTLQLHERGVFSWLEWAAALAVAIAADDVADDPNGLTKTDDGNRYYQSWLRALETLVQDKQLLSATELDQRKQAWEQAAHHTPHGQPVVLPKP